MYAYNLLNLNADLKDQPIKIALRVHLHITFNRVLARGGVSNYVLNVPYLNPKNVQSFYN